MKKTLVIIWIISVIAAVAFFYLWKNERGTRITTEGNLHNSELEFRTKSGILASQVSALEISRKELRATVKKDSAIQNDYELKLSHAYNVIKDLNLKIRNIESTNSVDLESSRTDTVYYRVDSIRMVNISDIHTPYFDAIFKPVDDSIILVSHRYHSELDIVISRQRAKKLNGKERFIITRLLRPNWQYYSTVVCLDPDARITSNVLIRFKKR